MSTKNDPNQPHYLKNDQYKTSANLQKRANLHRKYGHANWFGFVAERAGLEPGMRVLDIGCGAGWFWEAAAGRMPDGLTIVLADQSEGMVREARERVAGLGRDWQIEGVVADICALPFADAGFDRVLALHMLYHAPRPPQGVAEIARVLKSGGRALVSTNGVESMRVMYRLGAAAFGGKDHEPVADLFGLENGRPMLEAAFASVVLEKCPDTLHVTDGEDMVAALTSFPPGSAADAAQVRRLRALIADAMAKGDGAIDVEKDVGLFICTG